MRCLATNPHARPAADEIEGQLGGMIAALAAGTLPEAIPFPIFAEAAGLLKGGSSPLKGGSSIRQSSVKGGSSPLQGRSPRGQDWLPPMQAGGGLRESDALSDSTSSAQGGSFEERSASLE